MHNKLSIAIYSGVVPSTFFIESLIKGLAKKGHKIQLFGLIRNKQFYGESINTIGYSNNKWSRGIYYIKYSLLLLLFKHKAKKKLDNILKSVHLFNHNMRMKSYAVLWYSPNVFHVQWAKDISDWMWVQQFGIKLVLSLRGTQINMSPLIDTSLYNKYKLYFPQIDGFHAVSNDMAKTAIGYGANADKVNVIMSGVHEYDLKSDYIDNSSFKIISVGRPHWIKGYNYAIDAMALYYKKNKNFNYTIVGASNNIELIYHVKDAELSKNIILTDKKSHSVVMKLICNSDLLLLPSLSEGIANVVLEAMSLGTIVLSTQCGGMPEVIEDGVNGFLAPIRDVQSLANKIEMIKSLPTSKKKSIIENAKQTVDSNFCPKKMVDNIEVLYRKLYA